MSPVSVERHDAESVSFANMISRLVGNFIDQIEYDRKFFPAGVTSPRKGPGGFFNALLSIVARNSDGVKRKSCLHRRKLKCHDRYV